MKTYFLFSTLAALILSACSMQIEPKEQLEKELQTLISNFKGRAGVYVYHVERKEEIAIHADDVFTSASMVKVPIMVKIFDRIEKGELGYSQLVSYTGEPKYTYEDDFINVAKEGATFPVAKLVFIMLALSDNTASLWLQDLAGSGTAINEWLEQAGYEHTRVNSRTPGREANREKFGWGQTTPREMAHLVQSIYERKVISTEASEKMYRMLTRSFWDGEALSVIPPEVQTASKQGAVSQAKSEVVVVHSKGGTYVFCAMTDDQEKAGYEYDDYGSVYVRAVSKAIYQHYNPADTYSPSQPKKYWF
ncbi:serine hydrolase [bacterium]|nr:MAG: serine hydrolase [bacterium]